MPVRDDTTQQYLFGKPSPTLLGVLKFEGLSKQGVEGLQIAVVGA